MPAVHLPGFQLAFCPLALTGALVSIPLFFMAVVDNCLGGGYHSGWIWDLGGVVFLLARLESDAGESKIEHGKDSLCAPFCI